VTVTEAGRAIVVVMSGIPVPPFVGQDDARRFHQLLMLHLSQLKRPGEAVGVHQFLLGQVLTPHRPGRDQQVACVECERPYPCATILRVAVVSRFDVGWSPIELFRLLCGIRSWGERSWISNWRHVEVGEGRFAWESEPRFTAVRRPDGGWVVTASERGSSTVRTEPADDLGMIEFLADHVQEFPFPYGWHVPEEFPAFVSDGARAAARWWSTHRRLPYLSSHDEDGNW